MGHNKFSTYTHDEYKRILGRLPNKNKNSSAKVVELPTNNLTDGNVDWRSKGAVNEIQDQEGCGSCWAFSAVAAMESAHFLKTNILIKLSEQ